MRRPTLLRQIPAASAATTNASGIFTVVFSSATAGLVTGHAATDVSFARLANEQPPATPLTVHRETNGLAGNSADAVKRFVDVKITITPSGINQAGSPHTFVLNVMQDDGLLAGAPGGDAFTGFGAANNAAVTVTLTGINGAIPDISSPTDLPAGNPSAISGTTNASGNFSVVFSSATTGVVIGHGSADVTFARLPNEQPPATPLTVHRETGTVASPDAFKREVDVKISIAPTAVNEVGDPHTFTVTVMQDDGLPIGFLDPATNLLVGDAFNGFGPAANQDVNITITASNGRVTPSCCRPDRTPLTSTDNSP